MMVTNPEPGGPRSTSRTVRPTGSTPAPKPTASIPTKPATQRIAPATGSVKPVTQRMTTSTNATTGKPPTQRMATATSSPTSKIAKPQTGSTGTGSIKKTTQRATATASTTARRRGGLKPSAPTFSLPGTRKGKMIMGGVIAGILALSGVMLAINAGKINPDNVKKDIAKDIAELNAFIEKNPDSIIEIDEKFHVIEANDLYKQYAVELYRRTMTTHKVPHDQAIKQKEADREVKPWLSKYAKAKEPGEIPLETAKELLDEVGGHLERFGNTVHGKALNEIKAYLFEIVSRPAEKVETAYLSLTFARQKAADKGDFTGAAKLIADFISKWKLKEGTVHGEVIELSKKNNREAEKYPEKLQKDLNGKVASQATTKVEAKKALEEAKAGLAGFPTALDKLDQIIKEYK